ncbi:MAG: hypothetical protein LC541_18775 [Candidatus Thiodiazotropha sp.]|nr:hypothetical protein [Candidatus Thiodiazotropha sp.]MCM8885313.1 hypothetical protein [Candidatus Thiodiazotropha sp.]MCM8921576.1 hypothetical protein [Candidatus Thiodiazotropha sp.]
MDTYFSKTDYKTVLRIWRQRIDKINTKSARFIAEDLGIGEVSPLCVRFTHADREKLRECFKVCFGADVARDEADKVFKK